MYVSCMPIEHTVSYIHSNVGFSQNSVMQMSISFSSSSFYFSISISPPFIINVVVIAPSADSKTRALCDKHCFVYLKLSRCDLRFIYWSVAGLLGVL